MEKGKSKVNLPSTSDGIRAQEEANRLVEEETTMRKEVELFLQEELNKLMAEKDTVQKPEPFPRRTSLESKTSEKPRPQLKKSKVGVEQPQPKFERSRMEEDLLTLLDEPWDIPRDPVTGEVEDQWDKLSLLDESMLELKQKGPRREGDILEEEEEKKEEEGQLLAKEDEQLVEMSAKGGQHLMKPVFMDYREEVGPLTEDSKHSIWSMRSSMGAIFDHKLQHFQNMRGSISKKGISTLPFGYFSKSKRLSGSEASEKEEQMSEEAEPWNWMPRFLRKSKPKKVASFRRKSMKKLQLEGSQVTDLSKIFSEDFFKHQDRRGTEDIPEEDLLQSPEDVPQQNEEESKPSREETQKQKSKSFISPDAPSSSFLHMGHRINQRDTGHSREFPDSIFKDKSYKQKFVKHERDSKVAVPLPLQELLEEEVLAILKATLLAYQKNLGANHPLTGQMEKQVDKLHLQLQGRGII